ncbi:MAG: L,D-transpeptidase family protein [Bacteriovorax sp.]|nr:L,D-transpeptidase family protein [Bacteriovorax sp.]
MNIFIVLLFFIFSFNLRAQDNVNIDEVRVYKSNHRMDMLVHGKVVKSYHVMLGRGGKAPKRKEGDNLVPEGQYILDYKNFNSLFYKSIHVSYPNDEDLRRASEAGVEPGGDIMIHGYPNNPTPFFKFLKRVGLVRLVNWTAGCISVDDREMEEIFNNIEVPIPINIFH